MEQIEEFVRETVDRICLNNPESMAPIFGKTVLSMLRVLEDLDA